MRRLRYIQGGWVALLLVLVLGLIVTPASAATRSVTRQQASTSLNATVYISTASLVPMFQSRIDQRVPGAVSAAIANMVNNLPPKDQGWALQMANTLIQPSVKLTNLAPQKNGLATSLRLSLYAGDPQAINANMLIAFTLADSSTVQVSASPLYGSPALVNGPITTFQVPIGQLNSIATTPGCGSAGLAVNLQVPVVLGQAQTSQTGKQAQQLALKNSVRSNAAPVANELPQVPASVGAFVEIPASSLAAVGSSIGSLPINGNITAQNIQISVQGSNLLITSDILLGSFQIGTAVTTVAPSAANGNLVVHVLNTTLNVLQIFPVQYNTYNQQIEQTLNSKLGSALAGKFYITQAAIGANSSIPCAAQNSLILTGSTNIGG